MNSNNAAELGAVSRNLLLLFEDCQDTHSSCSFLISFHLPNGAIVPLDVFERSLLIHVASSFIHWDLGEGSRNGLVRLPSFLPPIHKEEGLSCASWGLCSFLLLSLLSSLSGLLPLVSDIDE